MAELICERWKLIPGFTEYEVSNLGRVRRTWFIGVETGGTVRNKYPMVSLPFGTKHPVVGSRERKKGFKRERQKVGIHILVARAFIGPRPKGMQINHKDGNKRNPCLDNIEYVTPSQNLRHAWATGLMPRRNGQFAPNAKLKDVDRDKIVRVYALGLATTRSLARAFLVSPTCVRYVLTRRVV